MQCVCGGDATTKTAERTPLKAELVFYQCSAKKCGRVSDGVLYIAGVEVVRDGGSAAPHARQAFNTLTPDSADELLDAARPMPAPAEPQASFDF